MADLDDELEAMEDEDVSDTSQAANVARWKALINDTEMKAAVVFLGRAPIKLTNWADEFRSKYIGSYRKIEKGESDGVFKTEQALKNAIATMLAVQNVEPTLLAKFMTDREAGKQVSYCEA